MNGILTTTTLMLLTLTILAGCSDGSSNTTALAYATSKSQDDTPPAIDVSAETWEEMSWDEGYW